MFNVAVEVVPKTLLSKGEDVAEAVFSKIRLHLPTLARICLLSAFLEEGLRLVLEFSFYTAWIETSWGCGGLVSNTILLIIITCKLVGSVMIAVQKKVSAACGILFAVILLEPLAYDTYSSYNLTEIYRDLALVGILLMLLAQNQGKAHTLFAGVPALDNNKRKNYLQLSGRCFLLFMFLTMVKYELSLFQILKIIVGVVLLMLVIVGYKTKLSALVLIVFLLIFNFYKNTWWSASGSKREHRKYKFFHAFSVIGGLFLVVLHGPGEISMDEAKKKW